MKKTLLALFIALVSASAQAADHWYRVELEKCTSSCTFYGSSPLSSNEFKEALIKEPFIKLNNLFYYEKEKVKSWADWDEQIIPAMTIRSSTVIFFMEYKKSPFEK